MEARLIHAGDRSLPPLVEVGADPLPLSSVVKPPDADALYEWLVEHGKPDADPSWASVWPAAAALACPSPGTASFSSSRTLAARARGSVVW